MQAVRLKLEAVGERRRWRTLGELLTGRRAPLPPEVLPTDASKVGGTPWLDATERWPRNDRGRPLELVVQLRFRDLPRLAELPEDGILSVFKSFSPDAFGVLWFPKPSGPGAPPPQDAPPPTATRECRLVGSAFDMYDLPDDLPAKAGLRRDRGDDVEYQVFESVLSTNASSDGHDHVLLGHAGEHRKHEDCAKAAIADRSQPVRPMNHEYVDPETVPLAERARFRLLLTMSFDRDFTPAGDNDLRLLIRDDDLAAGRLDRAAPLIHVTG
jgi:hypothetical protein